MSQARTDIRPAAYRDIPAMCALLKTLLALEPDARADAAAQGRALAMLLENKGACRVLVAERKGLVVGMCVAQLLVNAAQGALAAQVEDVVVDEAHRGRGIGRGLLAAAGEWAREHGVARMQLLADREDRAALEFCHRLGWSQTRVTCLRAALPFGSRP